MRKRATTASSSVPPPTVPQLLTIPEVASALRIGRTKVYDLINKSGLPAVEIGDKGKRVDVVDLNIWLASRKQAS